MRDINLSFWLYAAVERLFSADRGIGDRKIRFRLKDEGFEIQLRSKVSQLYAQQTIYAKKEIRMFAICNFLFEIFFHFLIPSNIITF
jgi:hypothetical protein